MGGCLGYKHSVSFVGDPSGSNVLCYSTPGVSESVVSVQYIEAVDGTEGAGPGSRYEC